MSWIKQIFGRRRLYRDLSEELRQHLEEKTEELVASGIPRAEAESAARREFGNLTLVEERGRETWQWPSLESLWFDLRYAGRQLRRQPSFTLVALMILAIGIGANTAVFSVINTILLQPLPFRSPERLAWIINEDTPGLSGRTSTVNTFEALTAMRSFEEISTYEAFFARSSYKIADGGEPQRVVGVMIAPDFLPFLGVKPMLGRSFTKPEGQVNGPGAAILSYGLWQRRYSSDPGVIGRQISVNDQATTIVGVMSPSFDFGEVFAPGINIDLYLPVVLDNVRDWGNTLAIVGRLKPGVTMAAAQKEANAIVEQTQRQHPEFGGPDTYHAILKPFHESVIGQMRQPILTLWAAVGVVLLIVCVNLSNLLIARGAARRKEMALRGALGAGRLRLARQLLTETFLLAAGGGALGVLLAFALVGYLRRFEGLSIPLLRNVQIDTTVLGVATGVTILTALLFGLLPALTASRKDFTEALKESGRGSSAGREHRSLRSSLVVCEVALACLLLVGAGLVLRSFLHVLDVNLGFQSERTYSLRVDPGREVQGIEAYRAYLRRLVTAAGSAPGVEAAAITDAVPLDSNRTWGVRVKGQTADQGFGALVKMIGPGLLGAMRTPILAGREFTESDSGDRERVVLINESLAHRLFPDRNPLMGVLQIVGREWRVVGVVADVRHLSVEDSSGPEFYLPILQIGSSSPSLVVRTSRPFPEVSSGLRTALANVAPNLPTTGFRPLQQIVERAVSPRRFLVNVLAAFAIAALALAAIGIYGVISYSVARRTSEIGIRMALGAPASRIRSSIVGDALVLTVGGVVLGAGCAVSLSSLLASLLFGVSWSDPLTYAGAAGVLMVVAVAAALIPAFRASRISPISALRAE